MFFKYNSREFFIAISENRERNLILLRCCEKFIESNKYFSTIEPSKNIKMSRSVCVFQRERERAPLDRKVIMITIEVVS